MTIFAIVNSLIQAEASASDLMPVWTLISPSSMLQGGNPYFVPDFASRFEARSALALRIGKLGKGVAPRFASRYVDAVAPAVLFVAADLLGQLHGQGLPWTQAISYDRALAIGKFQPVDFDRIADIDYSLALQSDTTADKATYKGVHAAHPVEEIIHSISHDNTIKTGDIILIGLDGKGPEVTPGMRAELTLDGEESLRFNIR